MVFTCGYVTKETAGGEEDACGLDFVQNAFAESQIGTLITSNAFPFQTSSSSTDPAAIGRLGTPGFLRALRNSEACPAPGGLSYSNPVLKAAPIHQTTCCRLCFFIPMAISEAVTVHDAAAGESPDVPGTNTFTLCGLGPRVHRVRFKVPPNQRRHLDRLAQDFRDQYHAGTRLYFLNHNIQNKAQDFGSKGHERMEHANFSLRSCRAAP